MNRIATIEPSRMPISREIERIRVGSLAGQAIEEMRQPPKRIKTGLASWDAALKGGLLVPSLTVLGAKPKCGKSTIMGYIADAAVTAGNVVYMIDLENGVKRIMQRLMARKAKIGIDEFMSNERGIGPEDRQFAAVKDDMERGALGSRLYLETGKRCSPEELEEKIRYLSSQTQEAGQHLLLIIDSLQKLPMNLSDRRSGIDGWLRWMEEMRETYQIAILVTSELKRPQEGQVYKPTEIAFKESGDVEYACDLAVTLDRSSAGDHWIDDPPENDPIKVSVIFNRDGPAGRLRNDLLLKYPYHELVEVPAVACPQKVPYRR